MIEGRLRRAVSIHRDLVLPLAGAWRAAQPTGLWDEVPYVVSDVTEVGIPVVLDRGPAEGQVRLFPRAGEPISDDAGLLFWVELREGLTCGAVPVDIHVSPERR